MLNLTELVGFGAGGTLPVDLTYHTTASSTTGASSYTFSSLSIGTARASRRVVILFTGLGDGARACTAVSIGGINALPIVSSVSNSTDNLNLYIATAMVPTGTTATVSYTLNGSVDNSACSVYTLDDNDDILYDTNYSSRTGTVSTCSTSVDTYEGGSGAVMFLNKASATLTPSGDLVENFDAAVGTSGVFSGSFSNATTSSNVSFSATPASSFANGYVGIAISFARIAPSKNISYLTTVSNTANLTTYTFTGVSFGSAQTDRVIALGFTWREAASITSVTIGGVSATQQVSLFDSSTNGVAIWSAEVPTGTTGTVSITFGDSAATIVVNVFRLTGLSSNTAQRTGSSESTTGSPAIFTNITVANPTSEGVFLVCGLDVSDSSPGGYGFSRGALNIHSRISSDSIIAGCGYTFATSGNKTFSMYKTPVSDRSFAVAVWI